MKTLTSWFGLVVDPDNIPEHKPGVYLLTCLANSKKYVGIGKDLYNRVKFYTSSECGKFRSLKIERAIKKYGVSNFKLTPIYYMIDYNRIELLKVEGSLVTVYDCVLNGYNIIEMSVDCSYGEEFNKAVAAGWEKPGVRENFKLVMNSPKMKALQSKNSKEIMSRPEVLEKVVKAQKDRYLVEENRKETGRLVRLALSTPEAKLKCSKTSKAIRARPDVKAKFETLKGTRIRITDGTHEKVISKSESVPVGWYIGRPPYVGRKTSHATKGVKRPRSKKHLPKTNCICNYCGVKFIGLRKKSVTCSECSYLVKVQCSCGCEELVRRTVYTVVYGKVGCKRGHNKRVEVSKVSRSII